METNRNINTDSIPLAPMFNTRFTIVDGSPYIRFDSMLRLRHRGSYYITNVMENYQGKPEVKDTEQFIIDTTRRFVHLLNLYQLYQKVSLDSHDMYGNPSYTLDPDQRTPEEIYKSKLWQ